MRRELSSALAASNYGYVAKQNTATITNLIVSEVSRATAAFLSFSRLAPNVVNVVVFFVALLLLDWKLTLAVVLAGGGVLFALRLPAQITRRMSKKTTLP